MITADLIHSLADGLSPASPAKTRGDLAAGLAVGAAITLGAVLLRSGMQPDLLSIAHGGPLLMKLGYALALGGIGGATLLPLLAPGRARPTFWPLLALPVLVLSAVALIQLRLWPGEDAHALLFGGSWRQCPVRVFVLSVPVFAGLCWAIRRQAPVRLRAAGGAAGLLAGGVAASLYALACTENGAGFVLVWYTLGIAISTGIGALIGPRVLRW